ncbi:hypothetical protein JQ604_32855 [Bradyrhizobium jicamae]|uniref:hypothetical protein n=1 Tax=Bradyrhizobium jicamae TaxID=280332 RepID=UPI001BAA91F3|nr:hypothetical protein [Bradyrhizobium jicamae]MBR0756997.1 hypothetical protein [Bradyrhizobium jicamae]
MMIPARHILAAISLALTACGLSACSSINGTVGAGMADVMPAWAGGLPSDAPPRPGTAKYDEFMRERERKRLLPASERGDDAKPAQTTQPAQAQSTAH